MIKGILTGVLIAGALGAVYLSWSEKKADAVTTPVAPVTTESKSKLVIAAGRVEPASEEIKIGSELDGKLQSVPVEEGDHVRKGQVIAVLVNGDFQARVSLADAEIREREVELERILNGNRSQEKREADASVKEAEAILANAKSERDRRKRILERGAIARTEFDSSDREYNVALARLDAVKERAALIHEGFRVEDRKRAEADLERAKARKAESVAMLEKTFIRSPINGIILRKKLRAGESVSGKGDTPIVTMGDISKLRIRADIDETDVARLSIGQKAYVSAAAYGDRRFTGTVVKIGEILGRKNVRTDEPTERVDTKILETLVELDSGQTLPIGLRVDTFIETSGAQK